MLRQRACICTHPTHIFKLSLFSFKCQFNDCQTRLYKSLTLFLDGDGDHDKFHLFLLVSWSCGLLLPLLLLWEKSYQNKIPSQKTRKERVIYQKVQIALHAWLFNNIKYIYTNWLIIEIKTWSHLFIIILSSSPKRPIKSIW